MTQLDVSFREAVAADAAGIHQLELLAFESDRLSPQSLRRLIGSDSARVFVGQAPAGIIAATVLLLRRNSAVARLYSLAVAPEYRRSGHGRRLLGLSEVCARNLGKRRLGLEVREDNADAARLYMSSGYRIRSRVDKYYADGAVALRMDKNLGGREAQ